MGKKMAKNVNRMASEVDEYLKRRSINICSFSWDDFYTFAERKKMKKSFMEQLQKALSFFRLRASFGDYAVVIHRDDSFSATKVSSDGSLAATE